MGARGCCGGCGRLRHGPILSSHGCHFCFATAVHCCASPARAGTAAASGWRAGNAFSVLRERRPVLFVEIESHLLEANLYRDHLVLKSAEALAVMCDVAIQPQGT